jgi:transposase
MGSKESGHRSAVMYTLIQSCWIIGVELSEYLRDVLENIPKITNQQNTNWTPKNWAIRKGFIKANSKAA